MTRLFSVFVRIPKASPHLGMKLVHTFASDAQIDKKNALLLLFFMPQSYTGNKGEDPTPKQLHLGLFGQGCNQSPKTLAWVAFGVIGPCNSYTASSCLTPYEGFAHSFNCFRSCSIIPCINLQAQGIVMLSSSSSLKRGFYQSCWSSQGH